MMTKSEVLVLNTRQMKMLLSMREVIEVVEDIFKLISEQAIVQPPPMKTILDNLGNNLTVFPAIIKGRVAGIKWLGAVKSNPIRGLPFISAVIILNDLETGFPFAILEGTNITTMRTAGQAAISAKYLAKKDSRIVSILGCGVQGRSHLEAIATLFDIEKAKIFDIDKSAMERYREEMARRLGIEIESSTSVEDAVAETDIVAVTVTSSKPVVFDNWIPKGCLVIGTSGLRNLDPNLINATKLVVGSMEIERARFGTLTREDIYCDLPDIISGMKPGRESRDERIVYNNRGMGSLDIATGYHAYVKAVEKGVGTKVKLF